MGWYWYVIIFLVFLFDKFYSLFIYVFSDRSNGFERQYFEKRNARAALANEAYKWSVEDM